MAEILLSDKTELNISKYIKTPSHAVLIVGNLGFGKLTIARHIAKELLKIDDLHIYPYYFEVNPENNLISIDRIRELKKTFQLKTTGNKTIRRVAVIENADDMNDESQNAILKMLEEPPSDSVIILTVRNQATIKPTIASRSQLIRINKPTLDQTQSYFGGKGFNSDDIKKFYLFTNGSIGIVSSFLKNDTDNINVNYINEAKEILQSSVYSKLLLVESISKEKETLKPRLFSIKQIAKSALTQAINKNDIKLTKYWLNIIKLVQQSEDDLSKGANSKLLLTNLFMHM